MKCKLLRLSSNSKSFQREREKNIRFFNSNINAERQGSNIFKALKAKNLEHRHFKHEGEIKASSSVQSHWRFAA